MRQAALDTLKTRWIGQGPKVDQFEIAFQNKLKTFPAITTGSGTDALHLAYILAGIKPGDEVAVPVFTCTATNIPLLWMGAKLVFIDVDPITLNIDIDDLKRKVNRKTKAIVTVDYAGMPCDYDEIFKIAGNRPVIEDAAHAVGASYGGVPVGALSNFTMFSFQAIKHITTGDGGMLCLNRKDVDRARLIRWFGIDRKDKFKSHGFWKGDIWEVGYKYQMTDIAASMGMEALKTLDIQRDTRNYMESLYRELDGLPNIQFLHEPEGRESGRWLMTVLVDNREKLIKYLLRNGIESNPLHYRNDQYTIFKKYKNRCPNMDRVEKKILCLPFHMGLSDTDIEEVKERVKKWALMQS